MLSIGYDSDLHCLQPWIQNIVVKTSTTLLLSSLEIFFSSFESVF